MTSKIKSYKGFNPDLTCRGFQYEVGKEYNHTGAVSACNSGFHACENPIDVLGFYPPCDDNGRPRRYCEVEQSGNIDRGNDKICSSRLRVVAEIGIEGLIKAGVKFIFDKVNWKGAKESNTGDRSAATNTGDWSAAANTGDWSAATNTGDCSAATNTGDQSAATNTGDQSAATNTGNRSAASVEGKESIAIVTGRHSRAKGAKGCWLVLTERADDGHILCVKAAEVDGVKIKADTWYKLIDGQFTECND